MAITKRDLLSSEGVFWNNAESVAPEVYVCGFCGAKVSSATGYYARTAMSDKRLSHIRICPDCAGPTLFTYSGKRSPESAPGTSVANVPNSLSVLYEEARLSAAAGACTAAVLVCRKMLMNIAVEEGAKEGEKFVSYVQYLADKGYVPPRGEKWVDYIRTRGNEANHEIELMNEEDAIALITFVEMLLRFIYEFPSMVPPEVADLSDEADS